MELCCSVGNIYLSISSLKGLPSHFLVADPCLPHSSGWPGAPRVRRRSPLLPAGRACLRRDPGLEGGRPHPRHQAGEDAEGGRPLDGEPPSHRVLRLACEFRSYDGVRRSMEVSAPSAAYCPHPPFHLISMGLAIQGNIDEKKSDLSDCGIHPFRHRNSCLW